MMWSHHGLRRPAGQGGLATPAAVLDRSAWRGKQARQGGPVRYAEPAGEVVAGSGLAAADAGEVVAALSDVEEGRGLRLGGLVEPPIGQPDGRPAGFLLRG